MSRIFSAAQIMQKEYVAKYQRTGVTDLKVVWDMMSDSKILALLADIDRDIDEDFTRLMFIEVFSRLKLLEEENTALRVLLLEDNIVEKELFEITLKAVRDFLKEKDREKAEEALFFSSTGVPFHEWVNFKLTGRFNSLEKDSGR